MADASSADEAARTVVSGGRRFADLKLMDRALDALHRSRRVELLVTGELPGAQQMAYYWAVRNRISMMQPDPTGRLDWSRWNRDVLKRFTVDGLVVFPGRAETDHLAKLAESIGLRVWRVPMDWRG